MNSMVMFHSYVNVYQRVVIPCNTVVTGMKSICQPLWCEKDHSWFHGKLFFFWMLIASIFGGTTIRLPAMLMVTQGSASIEGGDVRLRERSCCNNFTTIGSWQVIVNMNQLEFYNLPFLIFTIVGLWQWIWIINQLSIGGGHFVHKMKEPSHRVVVQ